MSISFACPGCRKPYNLADDWGGRPCRCGCGAVLTVPFPQPLSTISFQCPHCGKSYNLGAEWAGKTSRCPCGATITVPQATPSVGDLLDEAFSQPAPVQQFAAPQQTGQSFPGSAPAYQGQALSYSGHSAAAGPYETSAPSRSSRRRPGEMPLSVRKTIIGLYGASGLAVFYILVITYFIVTEHGIDAVGQVMLGTAIAMQVLTVFCGIGCGLLLWKRVSIAIPICALCGLLFMCSVFPLGIIFALVLYVALFSADMQTWMAEG